MHRLALWTFAATLCVFALVVIVAALLPDGMTNADIVGARP